MLKLTITSIDKVLFAGDVDSVTVPGSMGEMCILPNHAPLITMLKDGSIRVKTEGEEVKEFEVEKGFMDVGKVETVILV